MEKQRQHARDSFRQMRFGMFVHWGVYSLLERGEWVMHHEKIPVSDYEPLMHRFNPVRFSASEWVQLAKQAGTRYITITTKHHDGFCMYDSALTDYKITNTPFKRDVMRELSDACRRRTSRFCSTTHRWIGITLPTNRTGARTLAIGTDKLLNWLRNIVLWVSGLTDAGIKRKT
jgi:hypothetical protein